MVEGGFGTGQTYGATMVDLDLWMTTKDGDLRRIFHLWKKAGGVKLVPYPGEC